ncbi:hypothetical protein BSL78_17869 [Apostichopus japonicus]|uniref:Uncharacterized protein n=1 Tax=Stichopus japonicus TaxID=307972 RepID=A0A2G8KBB3_STIJA|nr:hypothetical protein BSL78_17869 [Apostichopus japonicus]
MKTLLYPKEYIPVGSLEELINLDDSIEANKVLERYLLKRLSILADVLSNAVATKLNCIAAVKRNQATAQSTTSDIQAAVVRFLKGASDREEISDYTTYS